MAPWLSLQQAGRKGSRAAVTPLVLPLTLCGLSAITRLPSLLPSRPKIAITTTGNLFNKIREAQQHGSDRLGRIAGIWFDQNESARGRAGSGISDTANRGAAERDGSIHANDRADRQNQRTGSPEENSGDHQGIDPDAGPGAVLYDGSGNGYRVLEDGSFERLSLDDSDDVQFSISENIQGEKGDYGPGVILDSNIFDSVKPRYWGKVLGDFVYHHLAGTELALYDAEGRTETVYLAQTTDRVKKDGAKNSHKVIDKLARYRGDNIRALATVHLSEALLTSKHENFANENVHQWMDSKGWEYRKVYLQDKYGTVYEAILNIANGRDRRILYDINNIRAVDKKRVADGVVPSTKDGRGSHINSNSNGIVTDSESAVNPDIQFSALAISFTIHLFDLFPCWSAHSKTTPPGLSAICFKAPRNALSAAFAVEIVFCSQPLPFHK